MIFLRSFYVDIASFFFNKLFFFSVTRITEIRSHLVSLASASLKCPEGRTFLNWVQCWPRRSEGAGQGMVRGWLLGPPLGSLGAGARIRDKHWADGDKGEMFTLGLTLCPNCQALRQTIGILNWAEANIKFSLYLEISYVNTKCFLRWSHSMLSMLSCIQGELSKWGTRNSSYNNT